MMKWLLYILCMTPLVLDAQDQRQAGKRQPSSRPIEIQSEADSQERTSLLPKIELPEFVITGNVAINPPDIEKGGSEEEGVYRRGPQEENPGSRERETIDLGNRFRQNMFSTEPTLSGNVLGSFGSFATTRLNAMVGQWTGGYDYLVKAKYSRTKGFASFGDASGGGIGVGGSLVLDSDTPMFDKVRIGGSLDVGLDTYRFYGSYRPGTVRDLSDVGAKVEVNSGVESPLSYHGDLNYQTLSAHDSTKKATENVVRFNATIQVPVRDFPLQAGVRATLGTVTVLTARNISLMEILFEVPRRFWGDFFASASIHGYTAKGMDGQSLGRMYPQIAVGYHVTASHTAFLSFEPRVEFSSLREQIGVNPYLSAWASLRHPDVPIDLSGAVESQWKDWLTTKATVRYQLVREYPLFADSTGGGMWTLAYGGRTTIASLEIEAVANMSPNDYFAGALVFTDARNSVVGGSVPYTPDFQASLLYRLTTGLDVMVAPRIGYVHSRRYDITQPRTMAGYLFSGVRVEYQGLPRWTFFGDIRNLFDKRYEVWHGYRSEPFSVTLGVSTRW